MEFFNILSLFIDLLFLFMIFIFFIVSLGIVVVIKFLIFKIWVGESFMLGLSLSIIEVLGGIFLVINMLFLGIVICILVFKMGFKFLIVCDNFSLMVWMSLIFWLKLVVLKFLVLKILKFILFVLGIFWEVRVIFFLYILFLGIRMVLFFEIL